MNTVIFIPGNRFPMRVKTSIHHIVNYASRLCTTMHTIYYLMQYSRFCSNNPGAQSPLPSSEMGILCSWIVKGKLITCLHSNRYIQIGFISLIKSMTWTLSPLILPRVVIYCSELHHTGCTAVNGCGTCLQ
jgi:hypothetical protein